MVVQSCMGAKQGCHLQVSSLRRKLAVHRMKKKSHLSNVTYSNQSTPLCSPALPKPSNSSAIQLSPEADGTMVEKGSSDGQMSDRSPTNPEQQPATRHQRTYSHPGQPTTTTNNNSSSRSGSRNSKKSQSWYNVLSPTYKQRNEDFRKLFKQLPDTERLIVDYSCALQRDILLQGRLYLSENWICFYSNIFRWETLLMVRLKDICSMTKEKTARLIPNAIQLCTDNEKHFFTSFGARDRTYMMMFRLWQNALLEKPLCPKELWHFVHQCYGNELGLTSDDEDYVPPDEDFNTMGYCEELPVEENPENNDNNTLTKNTEAKPDVSPALLHKSFSSAQPEVPNTDSPVPVQQCDADPVEDVSSPAVDTDLLMLPSSVDHRGRTPSPSLDLNDNDELPTELSDSSETYDEGEVQAFQQDLSGKQYINRVYNLGVDKMYEILFSESDFIIDFRTQRGFSDMVYHPWTKQQDGNQTRDIMYTVALSNPLIPKMSTATETQTLYKASNVKECYIIDAEVIAHDVPYHDYFYSQTRYMLTRVAKNKCRLRVSTQLQYRKQLWGLVKGFIERNCWSSFDDYFRHLEVDLNKLEVELTEPHRQSPRYKSLRTCSSRRRKPTLVNHLRPPGNIDEGLSPGTTPEDEEEIPHIKHVAGSTQTRHRPDTTGGFALYNFSKLLILVSFVLILLVFLNIMLFYKLWMLEYAAQKLTAVEELRLEPSRSPHTQLEWVQLLDSQQRHHDNGLLRWKELIKTSVLLLEELRESLLNLHKSISHREESPDSEDKQNQ
ncbi:GRAM domain-containing protein 1B-like isoform X3 [Cynoglossus semilaevis]|uniref:GRAM domain containing 1B n=1 Tax=Cynoglossus semilaevis TaxID=244447 RepID=A0A3P8WQ17_CYNSE|nr:GRAM domain-containing protein 1B-like isoform X3 [Cynoglossus semilaevis]